MNRILFMTLFIFLLLSCKKNPTEPEKVNSNIIPLAVGNQWNLDRIEYDSLRRVISTEAEVLYIRGDTTISGQHWFYRDFDNCYIAYQNTNNGVLTRLLSSNADSTAFLYLKYPAQVGDSYGYPSITGSLTYVFITDTESKTTVVSTDEVIIVPAGTFHCIKYRTIHNSMPNFYFDEYVSPSYGWIRIDEYNYTQGGTIYLIASTQTTQISIKGS